MIAPSAGIPPMPAFFITAAGQPMNKSQISNRIDAIGKRLNPEMPGNLRGSLLRKGIITMQRADKTSSITNQHLAKQMSHTVSTAQKYYNIEDEAQSDVDVALYLSSLFQPKPKPVEVPSVKSVSNNQIPIVRKPKPVEVPSVKSVSDNQMSILRKPKPVEVPSVKSISDNQMPILRKPKPVKVPSVKFISDNQIPILRGNILAPPLQHLLPPPVQHLLEPLAPTNRSPPEQKTPVLAVVTNVPLTAPPAVVTDLSLPTVPLPTAETSLATTVQRKLAQPMPKPKDQPLPQPSKPPKEKTPAAPAPGPGKVNPFQDLGKISFAQKCVSWITTGKIDGRVKEVASSGTSSFNTRHFWTELQGEVVKNATMHLPFDSRIDTIYRTVGADEACDSRTVHQTANMRQVQKHCKEGQTRGFNVTTSCHCLFSGCTEKSNCFCIIKYFFIYYIYYI